MPYIAIRSYPKDEETVKAAIEKINEVMLEVWGCPPQALTISHEAIEKENWQQEVVEPIIKPNMDKMYIVSGEKKY